jgi:hypothetical protein
LDGTTAGAAAGPPACGVIVMEGVDAPVIFMRDPRVFD